MVELASAARDPSAAPFADVLLNVGRPSLSGTSDMPVVDLAKPGQGNDGELSGEESGDAGKKVVDNGSEAEQSADTSAKPEGEADGGPQKSAGEDKTSPQDRAVITRHRNQAKAAEARAQKLADQLEQAISAINKLTEKPATEDPRPNRDRFDTPDEYDQALESWVERRATEKAKAEAKDEQTRQEQVRRLDEVRNTYKERADAFAETHPDYFDLVDSDDAGFTLPMTSAILGNEDGPQVAYHLAQNPEMITRIAKLEPAQQVYEVGKLAAKLTAPAPAPKPAPIKTLTGRTTDTAERDREPSMEQHAASVAARQKR